MPTEKKEQMRETDMQMPVNGDLAESFGQLIEMFPTCEKEPPERREVTKRWAEEYRSLKTSDTEQQHRTSIDATTPRRLWQVGGLQQGPGL